MIMKNCFPGVLAHSTLKLLVSLIIITGITSCNKDDQVELTFTSWRIDDVAEMDRINALDSPETNIPKSRCTSTVKLRPEPRILSPKSPYSSACARARAILVLNRGESWRV